jgi:RNA polymerase sigma-70 factor (ECF subfamily)
MGTTRTRRRSKRFPGKTPIDPAGGKWNRFGQRRVSAATGVRMAVARSAFEGGVMALLPRLLGVARGLTHNDADAEDLVAETVTRAWRALDTLECDTALRGWLFRILHNTFVSDWRRACARPQFEPLDEEADEATPFSLFEQMHQPFLLWFSNPEQEFLDKVLREDIEHALEALPERHRIVVVLADVEGFSYGEIAQALGVPVGTVRSRLARARGALQKRLWQQARDYGLRGEVHSSASREGSPRDPA